MQLTGDIAHYVSRLQVSRDVPNAKYTFDECIRHYEKDLKPRKRTEKDTESQRRWRINNRERYNAKCREYYAKNAEKEKERVKAWQKQNPDKVRAYNQKSQLKRLQNENSKS